ncbi:MAG: YiiX/YebB-like N1pC/P60 family cysteine hydrolase [Candidatus Sericytochromatia bacterium]|nr:YiiX/YebB-like N1pC/P60 family cysteine hydrolase [Candidatus Sericytochromatia bacterium]
MSSPSLRQKVRSHGTSAPSQPARHALAPPPRAEKRRELSGSVDVRTLSAPARQAEEQALLAAGWLPPEYVKAKGNSRAAAEALAMRPGAPARSMSWTDPALMLKGARTLAGTPELQELAKNLRRGDIVLTAEFLPQDPVTGMTGGPYNHALLVVKDGPQPEFIEAIGVTGAKNDPTGNRVRRSRMVDYAVRHIAFRVLRPADALPAAQREAAVQKAIAYAERQLGRPYDFAFTNHDHGNGGEKAFYCSELTFLAWTSREGAGMRLPLATAPSLNVGMKAVHAALDAANPLRPNETLRPLVGSVLSGKGPLDLASTLIRSVLPKLRPNPMAAVMSMATDTVGTRQTTSPRFVSPTDLAWGGLPVRDFNTKGRRMDPEPSR